MRKEEPVRAVFLIATLINGDPQLVKKLIATLGVLKDVKVFLVEGPWDVVAISPDHEPVEEELERLAEENVVGHFRRLPIKDKN